VLLRTLSVAKKSLFAGLVDAVDVASPYALRTAEKTRERFTVALPGGAEGRGDGRNDCLAAVAVEEDEEEVVDCTARLLKVARCDNILQGFFTREVQRCLFATRTRRLHGNAAGWSLTSLLSRYV